MNQNYQEMDMRKKPQTHVTPLYCIAEGLSFVLAAFYNHKLIKSDEVKNRALIYDPNTKKMFYAFIGYIPQIWDRRTNKYKIDNGLVDPDEQFMFKEGGVISM